VNDAPEDLDSPEGEECPWEQPDAVRRDCEPHRGPFLVLLGIASLFCGLASFLLVLPGLVGLALGVTALVIAEKDLARMGAGRVDPDSQEETALAVTYAGLGVAGVTVHESKVTKVQSGIEHRR
jgi:hypothetical protein